MKAKNLSRNQQPCSIKQSNSYISLSKTVLGNKKLEKTLTSSTSFTISQQDRFKNRCNYIYETTDLSGNMFKKKFRDPSPTFGNWENFLNRSIHQYKSKTKPEFNFSKDFNTFFSCKNINLNKKEENNEKKRKIRSSNNLKSTATGSISNLLNATPFEKVVKKDTKILKCNNIFTPEINPPKPKKHSVNIDDIKKNSSYAGATVEVQIKDFNPEKKPFYNYSKNKKITSLKSNIFDPIADQNNESNNKNNLENYTIDIVDNTKNKKNNNISLNKVPTISSQRAYQESKLLR